MADTMTPRQRWLAAIAMEPVDRLPFWPKIDGGYPRAQAAPFRDMTLREIHDWIGSDKHEWIAGCTRDSRRTTAVETTRAGDTRRTVYRTPGGETTLVSRYDGPPYLLGTEERTSDNVIPKEVETELLVRAKDGKDHWLEQRFTLQGERKR